MSVRPISEKPEIVGCKCGKSKKVSEIPDREYGQYYCIIECKECGYYWEGYMGYCLETQDEDVADLE